MEEKPIAVIVQKCSRITKNPFFNFLRCFRSRPENQHKSAIATAIDGAATWQKMADDERQPFREMALPYRKPASKRRPVRARSKSKPRQRRAGSRGPSRRRATSRRRKPTIKRRSKSRTAVRGRKPAVGRARSKTVRRSRKPKTSGRSGSRTVRRTRKPTTARGKTRTVSGRKPASKTKSTGRVKKVATRGRPKSVRRGRKRQTSRSRSRRRTTKRVTRPRVTRKKVTKSTEPVGQCQPCSPMQGPPTQTPLPDQMATKMTVNFGSDCRSQRPGNEPNSAGFNAYRESILVSSGNRLATESETAEKLRKGSYRP